MHRRLVERTLLSLVEETLVDVAVPAAQSRIEHLVAQVERVHQVHRLRPNRAQQTHKSRLPFQYLLLAQTAKLLNKGETDANELRKEKNDNNKKEKRIQERINEQQQLQQLTKTKSPLRSMSQWSRKRWQS